MFVRVVCSVTPVRSATSASWPMMAPTCFATGAPPTGQAFTGASPFTMAAASASQPA